MNRQTFSLSVLPSCSIIGIVMQYQALIAMTVVVIVKDYAFELYLGAVRFMHFYWLQCERWKRCNSGHGGSQRPASIA